MVSIWATLERESITVSEGLALFYSVYTTGIAHDTERVLRELPVESGTTESHCLQGEVGVTESLFHSTQQ